MVLSQILWSASMLRPKCLLLKALIEHGGRSLTSFLAWLSVFLPIKRQILATKNAKVAHVTFIAPPQQRCRESFCYCKIAVALANSQERFLKAWFGGQLKLAGSFLSKWTHNPTPTPKICIEGVMSLEALCKVSGDYADIATVLRDLRRTFAKKSR